MKFEQLFSFHGVSEERKFSLATLSFQGHAMYWWTYLEKERRLHHEPPKQYWNELCSALRRRHIPPYYDCELMDKLQRLKQGYGLTNAPSTFMRLMNHVLRDCIGKFVVVYFDNILIFSKSLDEHLGHLRKVLIILRDNHLYANLEKCTFCKENVNILGFIVGKGGVQVDPEKIKAIQDWSTPKSVGDVRIFHGLASFYRRFVKDFSTLTSPLNELVKKDAPFIWGEAQEKAFNDLKEKLTNALILTLPNFAQTFELEYDASSFGIGAVLLQGDHLIA
uniref:Retrovirus-related Pol polyprotein from transposon gypsy n=1 Tax=Cajanus cajan TaxID=3821 RepID=A0A151TZF0_CAJCA|nr:Retrovirus-related Pol polyprotein from transposon gypsy [Cajanus cajan]